MTIWASAHRYGLARTVQRPMRRRCHAQTNEMSQRDTRARMALRDASDVCIVLLEEPMTMEALLEGNGEDPFLCVAWVLR